MSPSPGAPGAPLKVRDWRNALPVMPGITISPTVSVTVSLHEGSNTQLTSGAVTLTILSAVACAATGRAKVAAIHSPMSFELNMKFLPDVAEPATQCFERAFPRTMQS